MGIDQLILSSHAGSWAGGAFSLYVNTTISMPNCRISKIVCAIKV